MLASDSTLELERILITKLFLLGHDLKYFTKKMEFYSAL